LEPFIKPPSGSSNSRFSLSSSVIQRVSIDNESFTALNLLPNNEEIDFVWALTRKGRVGALARSVRRLFEPGRASSLRSKEAKEGRMHVRRTLRARAPTLPLRVGANTNQFPCKCTNLS